MKDDVARVKSLLTLQRLLAPILALRTHRARRKKALLHLAVVLPTPAVLRSHAVFQRWPAAALQGLLDSAVVEARERGTTIGFASEPQRAADVFWLVSGKVVEVPNKAELSTCAKDLLHLPPHAVKTGPAILPSHFADETAKRRLPPLTPAQERLSDALTLYHAGQLVDAERLLLGAGRLRALRCQSDAVLLRVPLAACVAAMQRQPAAVRSATVDAARASVEESLLRYPGPPPATALLSASPTLAVLPMPLLNAIRLQLKPFVFLPAELICANVYEAQWVYFLEEGRVREEDRDGAHPRAVTRPHSAIGLHTFVQSAVPDHFDQRPRAVAVSYCELWGLPVAALMATCDATARFACAAAATQHLRARGLAHLPIAAALRGIACFASVSEAAVLAVSRALHVRVFAPGDTIFPGGRIPSCGIVVVAGTVHTHLSAAQKVKPLAPGQACLFSEALVRMSARDAVVAVSSATVLLGSPAAIFEAMEEAGRALQETQAVLSSAQDDVDRRYGVGQSEISRAQYAAAERVRLYRKQQAEAEASRLAAAAPAAAATPAQVLENRLLASLEVQLQALHPNTSDVTRFEFFRGAGVVVPEGAEPAAAAPPPLHRVSEFYTLDAHGHLVVSSDDQPAPHTAHSPPSTAVVVVAPPAAVALAPSPPSLSPRPKAEGTVAPSSATAAVASLRTAVRPLAPREKTSRPVPSSRVAALRAAASRVRDDADGVDRRRDNATKVSQHRTVR